jgi:ABC-2 type transport system permease protein
MIRKHVLLAVFRRNFVGYFSSPTGYVFITLFILVSAATAFLQERFFTANLANLDPLNRYFPYLLLFFAPAISMALWSEERKQGTDELLLTLPARDVELVLGKYLAAVGIYSVSLLFSLSHLVVLASLGRPDLGVMLGTYLGYWLLGSALLAVGSVASLLTSSMTVAFILGAIFCVVPVFLGDSGTVVGGKTEMFLESLGVAEPFRDLAKGVLSLEALVYFGGLIGLMIYLNLVLISRRHAAETGLWGHLWTRTVAILVAVTSLGVLAGRSGCRGDLTQERLYSLSRETRDVLRKIDAAKPVYIQAFVSPEVPQSYVETRETLLGLLREYKAIGGDRIQLRVVDTERYTPAAREAEEKGIKPEKIRESREGRRASENVYLGVSFASGGEEVVIPFFHRGLSVEYELTRSVGTAGGVIAGARRKRVGVVATDVKLFGGFDFENMGSSPEWSIIGELKKQYDVTEVKLEEEIKEKFDVLVAIMPSTLPQPKMDHLTAYIRKGGAALLFDDPLPLFNPSLGPREQRRAPGSGRNPFQPPQPAEPKGDIQKLMDTVGVYWPVDDVVWDTWNPHPEMQDLPQEFVFVGPGGGNRRAFNPDDPVSAGLQEMVLLCGGQVKPRGGDLSIKFTPLLTSTKRSGALGSGEVLSRSFFGVGGFNPARVHRPGPGEYVLAARVKGTPPPPPPPKEGEKGQAPPAEIHAIVVADVDLIHEQFFEMRRAGFEGLSFDNVTFVLNCVDVLAGDETYVPLRKRRPRHRTLESVESLTKVHVDRQLEETRSAEDAAKTKRDEAQARFDAKVKELKERTDLDSRTKDIMVRNLEEVENRRLEVEKQRIDDEKEAHVEKSKATMEGSIRAIQKRIRVLAVLLPPIPALVIGLLIFMARIKREGMGYLAHAPAPQGSEPSGEGRKP